MTRWYFILSTLVASYHTCALHRAARLRHETGQLRAFCFVNWGWWHAAPWPVWAISRCCSLELTRLRKIDCTVVVSRAVFVWIFTKWLRPRSLSHWTGLSLIYSPLWLIVYWRFYCKNCCCNNVYFIACNVGNKHLFIIASLRGTNMLVGTLQEMVLYRQSSTTRYLQPRVECGSPVASPQAFPDVLGCQGCLQLL